MRIFQIFLRTADFKPILRVEKAEISVVEPQRKQVVSFGLLVIFRQKYYRDLFSWGLICS